MSQNLAATLPASVAALTHRELVELFRRLNGGTAGFDTGRYKKAELLTVAAAWIDQGVPAATVAQHADDILAARTAAASVAIPAAPGSALRSFVAPAAPVPVMASSQPNAATLADALTALQAAQPAPQDAPGVLRESILAAIALTTPAPQPETVVSAQAVNATPAPAITNAQTAEIAAALASTAETHPAAVLPPMQDVPATLPAQPAPAGREYARTLFRDLPAAVREAIPATLTVPVFAHPDAEQPDTSYRFNAATLVPCLIAMATSPTFRVWFGGPRGTGKTEFARQIAARTGRALFRVNFNRFTEASEIIGDMGLVSGNTQWVDGPVSLACRAPDGAAVLLLDELTYGTPGALSCLNPLLERNGAMLRLPRTGEALNVPANLFVIAADNTFGNGDASGNYAARNPLGADTLDRFQVKLAFDYLPAADERALLRDAVQRESGKKPSQAALAPLLKILHVAREKAGLGELQGAPSFRGAVAFATLLAHGMAPAEAYTLTIVQGAPEESHEALRTIFSAHWPTNATGTLASFFEMV